MDKTNALRILDQAKINYKYKEYDSSVTNGSDIVNLLQENCDQVFKTLVTISNTKEYFVYIIPVDESLDLKKCAKIANVKNISMIKQKELLPLTGYIHGGCSPIGMKKKFKTFLNDTAILFDTIFVSGGRVGLQIEIDTKDLIKLLDIKVGDLI
ncbi:Cys-tRNA(Pro) deacylase [bacterium]|nr:Cys-tRNA(Pro) deacylase [bacterium]